VAPFSGHGVYNMFDYSLIHNYANDNMLETVFMPRCLAIDLVYHEFDDNVG